MEARCSGDAYCTACSNCSSCKNCSVYGGSCGVCRPLSKPQKRTYTLPAETNSGSQRIYSKLRHTPAYKPPSIQSGRSSYAAKKKLDKSGCNEFVDRFELYPETVEHIRSYSFALTGSINVSDQGCDFSKVEYYSCDGKTGFMILKFLSLNIVQKDVPMKIWLDLSASETKCNFLRANVVKKYESYVYPGEIR